MNEREWQFLSAPERLWRDGSSLPASYLLKCLGIKLRRRLWGRYVDRGRRLVWTPFAIAEADEPALVVRTYLEHAAVRSILEGRHLRRACELGCGYGRMTMVLQEFAPFVKGFEREPHLVDIARRLLPHLHFEQAADLALVDDAEPYDLVMTVTVLQHLTDADARRVCARMKTLAPHGHVLCVEKVESVNITAQHTDGHRFISRARSVATYQEYMHPFRLIAASPRPALPTEPATGTCMLFASPV